MKKTIFLFAFLFVSLFASANEVESNTIILDKSEVVKTKEITVSKEGESEDLLVDFCITRTNYYYEGTYQHMDGLYYDHYDVVETITCYS